MATDSGDLSSKLLRLFIPVIESNGLELWDLEILGGHGRTILRVSIDGENGVGIEDCARISRSLGALLDVEDPILGRYSLEVSSPGINRALSKPEHFMRYVGHKIRIKTRTPYQGNAKNLNGVIRSFHPAPDRIQLGLEKDTLTIPLTDIVKANIDYPFEENKGKGPKR